jgi:uncharacterized cupredoxin-like copper-binding protein
MKRVWIALSACAFVAALVLPALSSGRTGSASTVTFRMVEWDVLPTTSTKARPGKVTFVVRNAGKLKHEFVVIKTSKAAGNLAPASATEAPEKGAVGEIGGILPGKVKRLTLTLSKGHYALICNFPRHYGNGQFVDFYVR